jgi:hypothetical protein
MAKKRYTADCAKCGDSYDLAYAAHVGWLCPVCGPAEAERRSEIAKRAVATRQARYPKLYRPKHASELWSQFAHYAVSTAIRYGLLPRLDGSIACVDCAAPAQEYDHRDYSKPLEVVPVCKSCNRRRGTAIWPEEGQITFERIAQASPTANQKTS